MSLSTTLGGVWLGPDTHANRPATPLGGTLYVCTTHNKIEKYVSGAWSDWATLSSGSSGITPGRTKAKRTAGNVTLNSTTFVNIDTATDLVIAAAAGDVLEVTMAVRASTSGSNLYCVLDFHTIVSSSPVNSVAADAAAGTTNVGHPAWSTGTVRSAANGYTHFTGTKQYTVQSGDISSGNVTLRLRGFSGGSITLDASTDPCIYVAVVNLKQ